MISLGPGHSGVPGNEMAHTLATEAATAGLVRSSAKVQCRADFQRDRREGEKGWRKLLYSTARGQFTKDIDKTLPQRHSRTLYDDCNREEAAILAQLRTNKCRLNGYLSKIKASPTELCECGQPETVRHFLIE